VIIFELRCVQGHKFEGWFRDRVAFEEQQARKLVTCPVCGQDGIEVFPMARPMVTRTTSAPESRPLPSPAGENKEINLAQALQRLRQYVDRNFQDVGEKFCEVALRIHRGDEEGRNIVGTASVSEEQLLRDEGVEFFKIPAMKMDS
jgi:hypothetical protein